MAPRVASIAASVSLFILFILFLNSPLFGQATSASNWYERSFWGLLYALHPNANDTELGAAVTEELVRTVLDKTGPDLFHYTCKGHPGYANYHTKIGYPSPGIVKDELGIWRKITHRMGVALSVHFSGVWDNQAVTHHPGWAARKSDGTPWGNIICTNSDYLKDYMIPQMLEVIDMYDIDGFWIDGDCWAAKPCWCDNCRQLFAQQTGIGNIPKKFGDPHWMEWTNFQRQSFFNYVTKYCDAVHARKPSCLVCSNWMYATLMPDEITVPVDYLSGDVAPHFGLDRTTLEAHFLDSRDISWDLMGWAHTRTTDGPSNVKSLPHLLLESAIIIANGGKLTYYGSQKQNGGIASWHQELFARVEQFVRQRQPLCEGSVSIPQVAVLHSKHHCYSNPLYGDHLFYNHGNDKLPLEGAVRALLENHYHIDVLNEETLQRRIHEYNLIVIAEQTNLPASLIKRVEEYVYNGGRLLVTGENAAKDFNHIAGVEPVGDPQEGTYFLPVRERVVAFRGPLQSVRLIDARILARLYRGQELATDMLETPIATAAPYGKGLVAAINAPVFTFYAENRYPDIRQFMGNILDAIAPQQKVELDAPPFVELSVRQKENKLIVHLINRGSNIPIDEITPFVESVPETGPIDIRIAIPHAPKQVYLAPDSGGMSWKWKDGAINVRLQSLGIHNAVVVE